MPLYIEFIVRAHILLEMISAKCKKLLGAHMLLKYSVYGYFVCVIYLSSDGKKQLIAQQCEPGRLLKDSLRPNLK